MNFPFFVGHTLYILSLSTADILCKVAHDEMAYCIFHMGEFLIGLGRDATLEASMLRTPEFPQAGIIEA